MAAYTVFKISDIDAASINIKKPTVYYPNDSLTVFDLYCNNKPILILSSRLQICNKRDNMIRFVDTQNTSCLHALASMLRTVIKRLKNTSLYEKMIQTKSYHTLFDDSDNQLQIRDINAKDTIVFDHSYTQIPLHHLEFQDNVKIILYLKNFWINERNYGFNIKVSQILREEPLGITKSLFPHTMHVPPPPPPPQKMMLKINKSGNCDNSVKKNLDQMQNPLPSSLPVRPSLSDIITSKSKLRKTNILS